MSTSTSSLSNYFAELATTEAEAEAVTARLVELQGRVQRIKEQINRVQSPMMRMLPVEIIQEIFKHTLPTVDVFSLGVKRNLRLTTEELVGPLKLCSVSIMWRRIAQSLPCLWTVFYIHFSDESHRVEQQLSLLEEWIGRAGGSNVPISFHASSSERVAWNVATTEKIMKTLSKHCARWQDVGLRLPSPVYPHMPAGDTPLPYLRTIAIDPPGGQGDRSNAVKLLNAPQLRTVSLSCVYLRSMSFGWSTTTHLAFTSFYTDECLEAIRQAPLVEEIVFRNVLDGDDRHAVPGEPIVLDRLRRLRVENDKETDCNLFFEKIQTPALESFTYIGKAEVVFEGETVLELFKRSGAGETLVSLAVENTRMEEDGLKDLLKAVPSVKSLTLTFQPREAEETAAAEGQPVTPRPTGPLTDGIAKLLAVEEDGLCPLLETLTYTGPASFSTDLVQTVMQRPTMKAVSFIFKNS